MVKRQLRKLKSKLGWLNPWYLLILALVFGAISVYNLRQNNLNMVSLRDQVFVADKNGGDVETALRNLRKYIYAHMNTNLNSATGVKPPIQLKYTYERIVEAQSAGLSQANSQIYTDAQRHCEALHPSSFSGGPRVPCIAEYISSHGGVNPEQVPDSLYKFDFVSPTWTPDVAGLTLLVTIILLLAFVFKLSLDLWLKHELHDQ